VQFKVTMQVPLSCRYIAAVAEGLITLDSLLLASGRYPSVYAAGIRYKRQLDPHRWANVDEVIAAGYADCKNLACWLAAEYRLQGVPARLHAYPTGGNIWHAVVRLPGGQFEDPSVKLGMRRAAAVRR
jgi:hypothetical protein